MDNHEKKIQERSEVDMAPSDSRTVMGHCAAQVQISVHFKVEKRNRLRFNSSRICELCGALGEAVACPARKYNILYTYQRKKHDIFILGRIHVRQNLLTNNQHIL